MLPLVYNPYYITPLPEGHRFPMMKFKAVRDILLEDGIAKPEQFHTPEIASAATLHAVHTPEYVTHFCEGTLNRDAMRRIGFPWSTGLVQRTRTAVGGTLLTAHLALQHGLACNTAGGTHHAFPDFGSGFCIFNDLAVTAQIIKSEGLADRILIIDLDVHQGDGTALAFQNDPDIFTFSMHCDINFPFKKQHSDLDVALPAGMEDDAYLKKLAEYIPDLLSEFNPDLVLYDAGADPHKDDRLGKLALTDKGLYDRDAFVISRCLANGFPVACVIGGGYDTDIRKLACRHTLLHRAADALYGTI